MAHFEHVGAPVQGAHSTVTLDEAVTWAYVVYQSARAASANGGSSIVEHSSATRRYARSTVRLSASCCCSVQVHARRLAADRAHSSQPAIGGESHPV